MKNIPIVNNHKMSFTEIHLTNTIKKEKMIRSGSYYIPQFPFGQNDL